MSISHREPLEQPWRRNPEPAQPTRANVSVYILVRSGGSYSVVIVVVLVVVVVFFSSLITTIESITTMIMISVDFLTAYSQGG